MYSCPNRTRRDSLTGAVRRCLPDPIDPPVSNTLAFPTDSHRIPFVHHVGGDLERVYHQPEIRSETPLQDHHRLDPISDAHADAHAD